jgi:hypothetical protein
MDVWSFWARSGQGKHVLEPTNKIWPHVQKIKGRKKKIYKRNGASQASTRGRQATAGRCLDLLGWFHFFEIFLFYFIFGSVGNGPELLREWVYSAPIFWSLPLYLEVLNLPFLMEIGDFTFF